MTRWYLSPMIGDWFITPRRALIQDLLTLLPTPRTCEILRSASRVDTWAVVQVSARGFPPAFDDPAIALLADSSELAAAPGLAQDIALAKFGMLRDGTDTTNRAMLMRTMRRLQPTYQVVSVERAAARG